MKERRQLSHTVGLWCGRILFCTVCFAGPYFLMRWNLESQIVLLPLVVPLCGFLSGIIVTLLRKCIDWWYCFALALGWLMSLIAAYPVEYMGESLLTRVSNCILPCALFAITSMACNGILQRKQMI